MSFAAIAPFAASFAAPLIGKALGGLFGGGGGGGGASFPGFSINTPSFTGSVGSTGNISLGRTDASGFGKRVAQRDEIFGQLGGLIDQVQPGFGRFTKAVTDAFSRAKADALGDVRESFGKRRLLGSSFAADKVSQIGQEFAKVEERFKAGALLEEIATTTRLLAQQANITAQGATEELRELQFVGNLAQGITSSLTNLASLNAELEATAAAGSGKFFGSIGENLSKPLGGLLESVFDLFGSSGGIDLRSSNIDFLDIG